MNKYFKIGLIITGSLLFLVGISFAIFRSKVYNNRLSNSNVLKVFVVNKNEGVKSIGVRLVEEELIENKNHFYYYLWAEKLSQKIQAGNYELSPDMNISEMVNKMIKGEIKEAFWKLIIPEGFTNKKIVDRINKFDPVLASEFKEIIECKCQSERRCSCDNLKKEYSFLNNIPKGFDLEGYLFPDTYFVYSEDTALKLVTKFLNNFEDKINNEILVTLKNQNKNLHEIITMASIVEKEVRSQVDKKTVAGIFWNRVNDDYLLQSCATLAYVLGEDKKQYSLEDTKIESPFNTYTNPGLPPGPVSNPGLSSIEASTFPEKTDYYYFLSNLETGKTFFAKTLDEHNFNKSKNGL